MAHVNNFNGVIALNHAVENFEPVPLDNLGADAFDACRLSCIRLLADEFYCSEDRGENVDGALRAPFGHIFKDGLKISGRTRAVTDVHKTPQRVQNTRIACSLVHSPRSSSARPSRTAASSSNVTS